MRGSRVTIETGDATRPPACRWCGGDGLTVALDLGQQPPADLFPPPSTAAAAPTWPLRMAVCDRCSLAQLIEDPGIAEEPLGAEPRALVEQAEHAVAAVVAAGLVRRGTTYAEFDSPHGGSWRALLAAAGGDDRTDASAEAVDLVVDVFGLMHDADQAAALRRRVQRLAPGGTLLLQYHALAAIVRQRQWNALRHGHMAYYSTAALGGMLAAVGLRARRAWTFELYGGTVLLAASRATAEPTVDTSTSPELAALVAADDALSTADGLAPLAEAADRASDDLGGWLRAERDTGRTVLGYGAASRAVPLLVQARVDASLLPAVADASPGKHGRALPVTGIEIISPSELVARRPDRVLLFVPDLLAEVRAALPQIETNGGRWVLSEPSPRLA